MTRKPILVALAVLLWAAGPVPAADLPLATATGAIEKADKDSLSILTRGPDGKFNKSMTLRVTGTSRISFVTIRTQARKEVVVQSKAEAKDLKAKQGVVVIYAQLKDGPVLLAAVAHPAPGR